MSNPKIQGQRTATDRSQMTKREYWKGIEIREGEKSEEKGKGEQEIDSEECYIAVDFLFVLIVTVRIPLTHQSTITE